MPAVSLVGLLLGTTALVGAVRYATTSKGSRFASLPAFSFTAGVVSAVNRFDFLRRVWLYTRLRRCALVSPVVASLLTAAAFHSEAPPTPSDSAFTTQDAYALLWLASIVLGVVTSRVASRLAAVAMPGAHAAVAVHQCLRPAGKRRKRLVRAGIVDVLGERRMDLARAARALDMESGRIDLL